jgi:hypothetical protein
VYQQDIPSTKMTLHSPLAVQWKTLFLEPGIFLTAGWRNVKFNLQMGGSDEIAGDEIRNQSFLFRSGVSVTIGREGRK